MLEVAALGKTYNAPGGALEMLANVTFSLKDGETAAISGPSGSGKSTLLYILGGLEPPTTGSVRVDGKDLYTFSAAELAAFRNTQIGFVFQDHCLLPQLTVLENVLIPTMAAAAGSRDGASRAASVERARGLIEGIGLTSRIGHRPGQLSGGEKQRVAIARALIRSPRLVLCDEPTGNLDPVSAEIVARLLLDLHRQAGNILIVVTHSLRLASQFSIRFDVADKHLIESRD